MSDAAAFLLEVRSRAWLTQALVAAAELGIADLLDAGPLSAPELAERCGADVDGLRRLLRALAGHGVFAAEADGRYRLTERAGPLRQGAPDSVHAVLAGAFPALLWSAFAELLPALRDGGVAFERAHGAGFFDYLAMHPDASASFDRAMARVAAAENSLIAANFNFERFSVVADIGGGQGGLLAAVLGHWPKVRGILFDQQQVLGEPAALAAAGVQERCELQAGDFFRALPPGADLYMFKRILHDWEDARALVILRNARAVMRPAARVAVIDAVMRPGNEPDPNKDLDLNMMIVTGGRERTAEEFSTLFSAAGFQLEQVQPLPAPATLSIVEGRPV